MAVREPALRDLDVIVCELETAVCEMGTALRELGTALRELDMIVWHWQTPLDMNNLDGVTRFPL